MHWLSEHPFILFFLWSFGLACEYFMFGSYSFVRIPEDGSFAMGGRLLLSFRETFPSLGYWNLSQLCGNDTILGSYIFDLDSLPFFFLPGWLATGLVMWLQRFIAGYFTFRLLRETLNLDVYAALFAGLAYSLNANYPDTGLQLGFPLYYSLSIPGIPFFIWALSRLNEREKLSYLLAFGIGALFSLSTNVGFGIFVLPVIFFWLLFVVPRLHLMFWLLVLVFMMGFFMFELPILWPISLNASLSQRAYYNMVKPDGPILMQGMFIKDLLFVLIAVMGLVVSRGKSRPLVALVCAILSSVVFVIFVYPFFSIYVHPHLGFLRGFQFDRIYMIYPYLTIVAAAIGISCLPKKELGMIKSPSILRGVSLYTAALTVVLSLVGWQSLNMKFISIPRMLNGANYTTLYENPALQQLAETNKTASPFRVVTIPHQEAQYPYHLYPAAASVYGLETADGYLSVYFRRYQEYWEQVIWQVLQEEPDYSSFSSWGHRVYLFKGVYDLNLLSLANVRFIVSDHPLSDKRLLLLPFGSANRDRQITWQTMSSTDRLKNVLKKRQLPDYPTFVYENPQMFPRFFLVENVRFFDKPEHVLEAMRKAEYQELRSTAFLKKSDVSYLPVDRLGAEAGSIELLHHTSDRWILKVKNPRDSILMITNNYNPYWKATIDGKDAKVFPADHTFQGIYVSGGEHEIILEYSPPYAVRFGERVWVSATR